jgi:hypothetical protein
MSFEERNTWVYAVVSLVAGAVYLAIVLARAQGTPLVEVPYVATMLWSIGGAIVAAIAGRVLTAIAWPGDADKKDERDREIERFGEYVGQSFVGIGAVGALVLAMAEADQFWIANAIYLSFVLSALLSSTAKIVAYRRGFPPW